MNRTKVGPAPVTKDQVDAHMRPILERIEQRIVRTPVEMPTPAPTKRENTAKATPVTPTQQGADSSDKPEEKDLLYLRTILAHPWRSVGTHRNHLGETKTAHNARLKSLERRNLIKKSIVTLGDNVNPTLLSLTPDGYRALGEKPERFGVHERWQHAIHEALIRSGVSARIEDHGADVTSTNRNGRTTAWEVELAIDNNSATNVARNLKIGFDRTVLLCKNNEVKNAIHKQLKNILTDDDWKKVEIRLLTDLPFIPHVIKKTRGEA